MANRLKTGGRKAGTPNKLTRELRTALKNVLAEEIEQLHIHFETLEANQRIELLIKLLPYALPKVNAESYSLSEGGISDFDW